MFCMKKIEGHRRGALARLSESEDRAGRPVARGSLNVEF
jgi:hypothetical protein